MISAANPITAAVNISTGNIATPGFVSTGSSFSAALSSIAPANPSSATLSSSVSYSPIIMSSYSSSAIVETTITKSVVPKISYPLPTNIAKKNKSSATKTSDSPSSKTPVLSEAEYRLKTDAGARPYSFCGAMFKNIAGSFSPDRKKGPFQGSSRHDSGNTMFKTSRDQRRMVTQSNAQASKSHAKQVRVAAKILSKGVHSLTKKTASSVIDGFYTIKQSLSVAKVPATKHIQIIAGMKNKASEQVNAIVKGILPILRLAVPDEKLPLSIDLFIFGIDTMPVSSSASQGQDPLPVPVSKTTEKNLGTGLFPPSLCGSYSVLMQLKPIIMIDFIDTIKKSAVNYNRTGLSPPQAVLTPSTALLSALKIHDCSRSALRVSTLTRTVSISKHRTVSFLSHTVTHKTVPLPLLPSGGVLSKGRGLYCNNRLTKGGVS